MSNKAQKYVEKLVATVEDVCKKVLSVNSVNEIKKEKETDVKDVFLTGYTDRKKLMIINLGKLYILVGKQWL